MQRLPLPRVRGHQLLAAAMAFCSSQACQDDAPDGTPGMPSTPDMDGTNMGGPEDMGPDMDGAGAGDPGTGTSGEGVPTPSLDGNEGQGGAASDGTGGPADMPVATGGAGVEPGAPGFEQDDPNLHPPETSYDRVEIPADVTNVMSIDIDDQDRVYVLERTGGLKIWYPAEQRVVDAGSIPVFSGNEDGALNIRLDPGFSTNGWAYIYYSSTLANENVLARFDIANDVLDRASEKVLLRVPDQREERYHVAGGMDFDSKGNLFLAAGDNTDPFGSNGFSPHDERPGRQIWDSQRSAANSRDLRGKILRIRPTAEGGYEIPEGNLFTQGEGAREVYTMGNRNPFRIAVDPLKDWLYWGEVGPDAGDNAEALATRGPRGYDEINQAKGPGFFGWPYCIGNNVPYVYVDFAAALASRGPFNCSAPVNQSPNNTGLRELPPAQPAWIAYSYGTSPYPALGANGGRTAIVGGVYRWKPGGSPNKLPRYFDGSVIFLEFIRNRMAEVRTDDDGNIVAVDDLFSSFTWNSMIQARISPSGVLHVAQFGGASTVYRMNYVGNGQ
jgi:cytochrome c